MITYVVCDLFRSPARVLVNTVNTVGVMGKGIAKDFKRIYPDMFGQYQQLCEQQMLDIGELWLYKTSNRWVLNFPTKRHWRQPSRPEFIELGLKKFVQMYHLYGITTISFPQLGCGNGELSWETQVQPLMETHLNQLPINVFIHLQDRKDTFVPEHRNIRATREWLHNEPETLAFSEVWNDLMVISNSGSKFAKFNDSESFHVTVGELQQGLTLHIESGDEFIPSGAILDLWQQIRQSGFTSADRFPYGLDVWSDYVLPIMVKLPYVEPVVMADRYDDVELQTTGLRLALRPRQADLPLFSHVDIARPT